MKKPTGRKIIVLMLASIITFTFAGCESAESKLLKEATANFNTAVGEMQSMRNSLSSKISEGEILLSSTTMEELTN